MDNKIIAVVTGGSRGIGKEIAVKLAEEAYVIVNYNGSEEKAAQVVREIKDKGGNAEAVKCNVASFKECEKFIGDIVERFGKIDILVNNAGISLVGLFTDATVDDWNLMINTNLTSVFTTCKNIVPHMLHHHEGKIINISSIWGDAGASCEVLYSTTKGGINAFTKALAKEVAASNIQVNAIAFGMIDTEMNAEFDEEDLALIKEEIPADYIASPKEAAQMVYHVATSPAYMTGQVITFSGGWY